jgi:putative transposase
MKVIQAYRFTLDPTRAQEAALRSHAGAARFAWNWGLARCRERYAAERRWYTAPELHKLWNAAKKADPALAWWPENSKCAYQEAFRDLDRALTDFIKSKKGERKGSRLGFPKFKKRGRCRDSFRLSAEPMRCTGTQLLSRNWAPSVRTSPPGNSRAAWRPERPTFCPPRSHAPHSGGWCRSP